MSSRSRRCTDNLFKKSWLRREPDGRAHRYAPMLSREQYGARLMRDALDSGGDPQLALQNFIGQMSATETAALHAGPRRPRYRCSVVIGVLPARNRRRGVGGRAADSSARPLGLPGGRASLTTGPAALVASASGCIRR